MKLDELKAIIKAEIKSLTEEQPTMEPEVLDISTEQDEDSKYDSWNFGDTEYYTGM